MKILQMELRRMLKTRLTWGLLSLALLLSALLAYLPVTYCYSSYTDEAGNPALEKPIVEPWKCPYHNRRMCMEIMRRSAG